MRHGCFLFAGILCSFVSSVLGSYDSYGSTQVHPHHGNSAGSYYHYHVPLVGHQQHYQPQHHHDHSHFLWPLLLLLLALPLLFLPLLPLLLLPLGLSLLALLAPGGMMMMMMMMMMGGGMMMRGETISGRAFGELRTFGEVVIMDVTSLFANYARSLDLDQCPQRLACELGTVFLPESNGNVTDTETAKSFANFIMDQYIPKERVKRAVRQFEQAFWKGHSQGKCTIFQCQPTFRIYQKPSFDQSQEPKFARSSAGSVSSRFNESKNLTQAYETTINYVYPSSKNISNDNNIPVQHSSSQPPTK